MFSQKPEEKAAWAPLPSEPLDRDESTDLPEAPVTDPLTLGIGGATNVSIPMATVSVPVGAAPVPDAPELPAADPGANPSDAQSADRTGA